MGLDMYLYAKDKRKEEKVKEVIYWRKANHIHKWFVDNVQGGEDDCEQYLVSREQLQELLSVLKEIRENNELASEKLPTQSGFFFGDTEYDAYYFEENIDTIKNLESILEDDAYKNSNFCYYASW